MRSLFLACLGVTLLSAAMAQNVGATRWATATSTRPSDGRVIVYRFVQEYSPTFDASLYPVRVTITWPYQSSNGMPTQQDREAMDRLEDRLASALQTSPPHSLALVRSGDDLRQWVYYTGSQSQFLEKLSIVLREQSKLPVTVEAIDQPGWETYRQVAERLRK